MDKQTQMGVLPISKLLIQQSIPSAIGIFTLSVYNIVDAIFVGKFVGSVEIGAIGVVMPITFFMSALGMAIGVGGASIIGRAFGAKDDEKAFATFGNQTILTMGLSILVVLVSWFFSREIILLFGGQGDLLVPSLLYFKILLPGVPFLAWAMMSNNVLRAEGLPQIAMITMLIPAIVNIIFDPLFILVFKWGLAGAAWATTISYIISGLFTLYYFNFGKSKMSLSPNYLKLDGKIIVEIISIGGVTFLRQASVSLLAVVLNNTLFVYGKEMAVSAYGIIGRLMMFINFPVFGLVQGFLPIASYNFGAKKWERVEAVLKTAIYYGLGIAVVIFIVILVFAKPITQLFTNDTELINLSHPALRWVFLLTPLLIVQLISSAYYQAIGKVKPAFVLSLLKQIIFLIPLVLILPKFFGINGVWYSFPLADLLTTIVSIIFIAKTLKKYREIKDGFS